MVGCKTRLLNLSVQSLCELIKHLTAVELDDWIGVLKTHLNQISQQTHTLSVDNTDIPIWPENVWSLTLIES